MAGPTELFQNVQKKVDRISPIYKQCVLVSDRNSVELYENRPGDMKVASGYKTVCW